MKQNMEQLIKRSNTYGATPSYFLCLWICILLSPNTKSLKCHPSITCVTPSNSLRLRIQNYLSFYDMNTTLLLFSINILLFILLQLFW